MNTNINGRAYAWSDIRVHLLGNTKPIFGITDVNWDSDAANEWHHGIGIEAVAWTPGQLKCSGSMKFHMGELNGIRAALPPNAALNQLPPFDIIISWEGEGLIVHTKTLKGVLITKESQSNTSSTALLTGEISFTFLTIKHQ